MSPSYRLIACLTYIKRFPLFLFADKKTAVDDDEVINAGLTNGDTSLNDDGNVVFGDDEVLGLAPIAQDEDLESCLNESIGNLASGNR